MIHPIQDARYNFPMTPVLSFTSVRMMSTHRLKLRTGTRSRSHSENEECLVREGIVNLVNSAHRESNVKCEREDCHSGLEGIKTSGCQEVHERCIPVKVFVSIVRRTTRGRT
jgi:hypothetical protein